MRKVGFATLIGLIFAIACTKKDKESPKPQCDTGIIRFTNNSNNPYDIFIDGEAKGRVAADSFLEFEVPNGKYNCDAVLPNGYTGSAVLCQTIALIFGCDKRDFEFPEI